MIEIVSRLEADINSALRGKLPELATLRILKSALHNEVIARVGKETGLDEDGALAIFRRELKKRQEAAKLYEQGGRLDLAAKEKDEAEIIFNYLPAAPNSDDIKNTVVRLKQELNLSGVHAMGQLTKAVMAHYNGAADGQTVSSLVREVLK
jgi:uncharacterized protein YqeY